MCTPAFEMIILIHLSTVQIKASFQVTSVMPFMLQLHTLQAQVKLCTPYMILFPWSYHLNKSLVKT